VVEEFNPLKDVDISPILLTRNNIVPKIFKRSNPVGGFLQNLMVYKGISSLYDGDI
jgi:hypothetical protein